jgi:hypothetical protein
MALLSAAELADLQAEQEAAMPDTCELQRPGAPTRDSGGGTIPGTPVDVAMVPCRYAPSTAGSRALFGPELATLNTWDLTVPLGTDIRPQDTARIAGVPYRVIAVRAARSFAVAVQAIVTTET